MMTPDVSRRSGFGPDFGRRYVLKLGSLGLLGMINLPDFLRLQNTLAAAEAGPGRSAAKAQACILIWLGGAQSHGYLGPEAGE